MASPLINWVLRALQFLFGIVILGLSVTLIRGHHWGALPSSLGYAVFVGGVTIVASLVGVAATWVTVLEGIVGLAIDAVVAVLNVAGGIFLALKLKGVTCKVWTSERSNDEKLINNDLFNGGCQKFGKETFCWVGSQYQSNVNKMVAIILGHCRESQAVMVFMFLAAVLLIASGLMAFLKRRKGY